MLTTNRSVPTITRGLAVCRVCGSPDIVWLGAPEYLTGYSWDVWECSACGCCFTKHDAAIYDILHETGGISYYSDYKSFAKECQSYFAHGDINALERLLIGVSKYKLH
jgi:hypothetical protein